MNKGDSISPSEWLYRRGYCTPERKYCNPDGTATSRVFKLREQDEGKLSVDLKSKTTPISSVGDPSKYFLFELKNSTVKEIGLDSIYDPLDDGVNDAHSLIIGMSLDDEVAPGYLARKSKRVII